MFIHNMYFENFRNFKKPLTLNFQKGINLIYGNNGAGKSSIEKALRLLLLDISDAKTLSEYVNEDVESFKIKVEFYHNSHEYKLTMEYNLKSKITKREVFIDDFEIPKYNTVTPCVEFLNTLFDSHLTSHSIAMMQGSDAIITAKDSERLELFKKIKDINYQKEAKDIEIEMKSIEENELKNVDLKIGLIKNKVYDYFPLQELLYTEIDIKEFTQRIEELNKTILLSQEREEDKKRIETEIEQYDGSLLKNKTNLVEQENTYNSISTKLSELSLDGISLLEEEITILQEKLKDTFDSSTIEKDYENKVSDWNNSLLEAQKELGSLILNRIKKTDYAIQIEEVRTNYIDALSEQSAIKKVLSSCKNGICPTCGKDFDTTDTKDSEEKLSNVQAEILIYEANIKTLQEAERKQTEAFQELETNKQLKNSLTEKIEVIEKTILQLEEEKEQKIIDSKKVFNDSKTFTEKEISSKKHLIQEKKNTFNSMKKLYEEQLVSNRKQKDNLIIQQENLEATISTLKEKLSTFSIVDVSSEKEKKLNFEERIINHNEINTKNEQAKKLNKNVEKQKEIDKKELVTFKKDREEYLNNIIFLKEAKTILLKHFPNYIINETIADTEMMMNNFIEDVYDKPLNINLRSTSSSLKLEYGQKRKRDCRNLSGAENSLVCLSFIHGLNQQMDLNFLALDEVDAALNQENTLKLFEIIDKMNYSQLWIITHNQTMQSALIENEASVFEFTGEGVKVG